MKKTLRVDMIARCSVCVSVDEEKFENGDIDLEANINDYLNQGNLATSWELEDPDNGIEEVQDDPEFEIE